MTEAEFRKALRRMERSLSAPAMTAGSHDDWVEAILRYGPAQEEKRRRHKLRFWWALALVLAAVFGLIALMGVWMQAGKDLLGKHFFIVIMSVGQLPNLVWPFLLLTAPAPLTPLLMRLDDARLVPFWLEALTDCAPGQRPPLHERLTRHLPRYAEPLSFHAQKALLNEVRRLSRKTRTDEESAFLLAALVSLDRVDTVDTRCHDALTRLAEQSQEHLKAAAEDALLRVRR